MMKKRMTERKKGWLILSLSLDAFAGLGLEVLLAFWLEPMIYGRTMEQWNTWQSVLHWCITCKTLAMGACDRRVGLQNYHLRHGLGRL